MSFSTPGLIFAARDDYGNTALMEAARYNENLEVTRMLLDEGADLHARDDSGWTVFMHAAGHNENLMVARLLLDAGADLHIPDHDDWTALMAAAADNPNPDVGAGAARCGGRPARPRSLWLDGSHGGRCP